MTEKIKTKKPVQTTVALSSPGFSGTKSNSLLISNNHHHQQREPSPPTIQILENVPDSSSQSQEDQEISQALQAIVDGHIPSPKMSKPKAMVRILSPSQSKSLISSSSLMKQDKLSKSTNEQVLSQQLIQMSGAPKQTIQVIQAHTAEDGDKKTKLLTASQPQQIIQNVTAQQLQNIKNITLLRNNSPIQNIDLTSSILTSTSSDSNEVKSITVTVSKPTSLSDQITQPGIQIKTPNNLTPAQQQQILQTIKQKILPQTVIASQQQQLLLKQKLVQKQGQTTAPGISLLGSSKINTGKDFFY